MSLDSLRRLLTTTFASSQAEPEADRTRRVRLATATILLEIAYADESFSNAEQTRLLSFLQERFGISDSDARALVESADEMRSSTIDHWNLTNLIRTNTSLDERIEIVKTMWRMVYSDGDLHQYENYLVRKLADLLGLEHHVMIDAKLAVQAESAG